MIFFDLFKNASMAGLMTEYYAKNSPFIRFSQKRSG